MDNKTVQYKRTLRGSVGAGVGALFNGDGRRFFILEHRDASKYHQAGESQRIIIDQIELGRDSSCQVRFDDETFPTVSRRHAAIVKDGERWKLVQLSTTNSTFLNGHPVTNEWYLENGDEIQLSVGGPRMGFIVPAGKQGLVSSIKLTQRLDLFRKQALRPYKTAIACMAVVLLLLSAGGGYKMYDLHKQNLALEVSQGNLRAEQDSLRKKNETAFKQIAENKKQVKDLFSQLKNIKPSSGGRRSAPPRPQPLLQPSEFSSSVFYIELKGYTLTMPDGREVQLNVGDEILGEKVQGMSGSGFLLDDGTFVTARHVVEPWVFSPEGALLYINACASSGGKAVAHFYAVSSDLQLEFSTTQFHCNRSTDVREQVDEDLKLRIAQLNATDYAYGQTGRKGKLHFSSDISRNLKAGEKLFIYGFPLGLGGSNAKMSYSSAEVARDGLAEGNYILTTASGFEHGNSGGPVLVERDGKKTVVGLVSGGAGRSTGFVVPIAAFK